jgi:hypothetical protein
VSDRETLAREIANQTHFESECGRDGRHTCPLYQKALALLRSRDERALRIVEESGLSRETKDGLKRRLEGNKGE